MVEIEVAKKNKRKTQNISLSLPYSGSIRGI